MTLNEVLKEFPVTAESDWKQHPRGGGWVYKEVTIDADSIVEPDAVVCYRASIEKSVIKNNARVGGWAYIKQSTICGGCVISGNSRTQIINCHIPENVKIERLIWEKFNENPFRRR